MANQSSHTYSFQSRALVHTQEDAKADVTFAEPAPLLGLSSIYATEENPGTANLIKGWQFDKTIWKNESIANYRQRAPLEVDLQSLGLKHTDYVSGMGSGNDLLHKNTRQFYLDDNSVTAWVPQLIPGYYYFGDREHWLFSDDSERILITESGTDLTDNFHYLTLPRNVKTGTPITITGWVRDDVTLCYVKRVSLTKTIEFSGKPDTVNNVYLDTKDDNGIIWANVEKVNKQEFLVNLVDVPIQEVETQLITNNIYTFPVGTNVAGPFADETALQNNLEYAGQHNGADFQVFYAKYAPRVPDSSHPTEVYSVTDDGLTVTQWAVVDEGAPGVGEVTFDPVSCRIVFGDASKPGENERIYIRYEAGLEVEYEPEFTESCRSGYRALLNSVYRTDPNGFVLVENKAQIPYRIELTSDLDPLGADVYGPMYAGNNTSLLTATVYDENDQVIENVEVIFEITSTNPVGGFGTGGITGQSFTDENGEAVINFNGPATLADMAIFTQQVNIAAGDTTVTLPGIIVDPTLINEIFLYEVLLDDLTQGIGGLTFPNLATYYSDYFTQQGITGFTADQTWEETYRNINMLLTPKVFSSGLTDGRRQLTRILITFDGVNVTNPHSGDPALGDYPGTPPGPPVTGGWTPLTPTTVTPGVTDTDLFFAGVEFPVGANGTVVFPYDDVAGYYAILPSIVTIRAKTLDPDTGSFVFSTNEITIQIRIPSHMNGLTIVNTINDLPEALQGKYEVPATIPFGFRLPSSGATIASALSSVTFLSIQPQGDPDIDNAPVTGVVDDVARGQTVINVSGFFDQVGADVDGVTLGEEFYYLVDLDFDWVITGVADEAVSYTITNRTVNSFTVTVERGPEQDFGTMQWTVTPVNPLI